jgi:hypothetical protein
MCSTYTDNTRQGREKLKKRAMVHLLLRIRRVLGLYEGRTEYDGEVSGMVSRMPSVASYCSQTINNFGAI